MRILITNDDGIQSPILPILASWAKKHGEVTLCAPKVEQSGKSHSIDFRNEIEVKKVDLLEGVEAYSVDSTPADCVRFAVNYLERKYDLCISGVNRGYNLGADMCYSGTIGGIMEAVRYDIKGIAVSTDVDILLDSEKYFDDIYNYFVENKLFEYSDLYNVNIPHPEIKGFKITEQGGIYYSDNFVHQHDDMYLQLGAPVVIKENGLGVDINATTEGYISVTPLARYKTNFEALKILK